MYVYIVCVCVCECVYSVYSVFTCLILALQAHDHLQHNVFSLPRMASIKQRLGVLTEAADEYRAILDKSADYVPALKGGLLIAATMFFSWTCSFLIQTWPVFAHLYRFEFFFSSFFCIITFFHFSLHAHLDTDSLRFKTAASASDTWSFKSLENEARCVVQTVLMIQSSTFYLFIC